MTVRPSSAGGTRALGGPGRPGCANAARRRRLYVPRAWKRPKRWAGTDRRTTSGATPTSCRGQDADATKNRFAQPVRRCTTAPRAVESGWHRVSRGDARPGAWCEAGLRVRSGAGAPARLRAAPDLAADAAAGGHRLGATAARAGVDRRSGRAGSGPIPAASALSRHRRHDARAGGTDGRSRGSVTHRGNRGVGASRCRHALGGPAGAPELHLAMGAGEREDEPERGPDDGPRQDGDPAGRGI